MEPKVLFSIISVLLTMSCMRITEPDGLVPQTADRDPSLPSIVITVAGKERVVHTRTFGDSSLPVLLIVHGSLSDMRPYLVFRDFSDRYHVVFWDMRGNGLSERVTEAELSYANMVEEYHAIKEYFSPDSQVSIIGHSWSAVFCAMYIQKYPDDICQAVLMEPIGLKDEFMDDVGQALNLTTSGYLEMSWASDMMTPDEHEDLDYRMLAMLSSGVRNFSCDPDNLPPWPVWRVGGLALIVWERSALNGSSYSYDWTKNASRFTGEVLFVGSSCSPIGYQFQEKYNEDVFPNARVLRIENSGHRLVTEQPDTLIAGLRGFLQAYKRGEQ